MIVVFGFLLAVISVPLLGGKLTRLESVTFNKPWLITAAMIIQIPITTFAAGWFPEPVTAAIHLVTYFFAFAFVWFNKTHVGMIVLVVGAMCNFAAIGVNGGVMPASEWATRTAGIEDSGEFMNSAVVEGARLQILGDVLAIPEGWPLANVFSIGDILLVLGGGYMLHWLSGSALFPKRHRDLVVSDFWARFEADRDDTERMIDVVERASLRGVNNEDQTV